MKKRLVAAWQLCVCIGLCVSAHNASGRDRVKVVGTVAADIIVLQPQDRLESDAVPVRSLVIGGRENAPECSYFEIIEKAKEIAASNGASIIKIDQHDRADGLYCDRVTATLYKSSQAYAHEKEFSWRKDRKLIWSDFRGSVPRDASEVTAATISCEIGFETNTISVNHDDLRIHVYNKFSKNDSWSRADDQNAEVLQHEQGHFDLCELYTRKLRERLSKVSYNVQTMKSTLRNTYEQVLAEYRVKQDQYETETQHGVNTPVQKRWQQFLANELSMSEQWMES